MIRIVGRATRIIAAQPRAANTIQSSPKNSSTVIIPTAFIMWSMPIRVVYYTRGSWNWMKRRCKHIRGRRIKCRGTKITHTYTQSADSWAWKRTRESNDKGKEIMYHLVHSLIAVLITYVMRIISLNVERHPNHYTVQVEALLENQSLKWVCMQ